MKNSNLKHSRLLETVPRHPVDVSPVYYFHLSSVLVSSISQILNHFLLNVLPFYQLVTQCVWKQFGSSKLELRVIFIAFLIETTRSKIREWTKSRLGACETNTLNSKTLKALMIWKELLTFFTLIQPCDPLLMYKHFTVSLKKQHWRDKTFACWQNTVPFSQASFMKTTLIVCCTLWVGKCVYHQGLPPILQITLHLASSLSRASCPPLCSYYTVPQDPTPAALSTRRVSESAPSESSKGDRGGSECSHFKHRDPLLCGGSQQQRSGMHGRQEVKFWESTALQEYKTITDER